MSKKYPPAYWRTISRRRLQTNPAKYGYRGGQPSLASKAERVLALREAAMGRWYGLTREQLLDAFPEFYPDREVRTASERRFYRDLRTVCADGRLTWSGGVLIRPERLRVLMDAT